MRANQLKIKPIHSINEVRQCFAFFKRILLNISQNEIAHFTSFHETHEIMVENISKKTKLQFFAELNGEIVGCIIAHPQEGFPKNLMLPVLAVDEAHRKTGIAKQLMAALVQSVKPKGFKTFKILCTHTFSNAIIKLGFTPFLYIEATPPQTIDDILRANTLSLPFVESQNNTVVKFAIKNYDEAVLRPFVRRLKNIEATFIFEKKI